VKGLVRRSSLLVLALLMLVPAGTSSAQAPADSAAGPEEPTDARDMMERILHRHNTPLPEGEDRQAVWLRIPFISSNPGTGTLLGGGTEVTFFRGDPASTHASTVVGSVAASWAGRMAANARVSMYGSGNRWLLLGDNRFERMSQYSYGLGTGSIPADRFATSYSLPRASDIAFRRVYKDLYAGVGFHFSSHNNIGPVDSAASAWDQSAYADYSRAHRFDLHGQESVGTSVNVRFDDRDSSVNASKGMLLAASYRTYFNGLLGGDSSWHEVNVDVRGYRALAGSARHVLAMWAYADLVTGGVAPYFDLPATGMDMQGRSGRGYAVGRFRGEHLVYGEVEYRATLTRNGLVGMVAFLNTTTVSNRSTGETLFHSMAPGAGVGIRLLADKLSRTSICLDAGFGRNGSHGVYLALQETF
jgi:hypothetical protein